MGVTLLYVPPHTEDPKRMRNQPFQANFLSAPGHRPKLDFRNWPYLRQF